MIRSVTVTNHNRESLTMDLYRPEKTGLNIKNIEGLGPPKASINSNEIATMDGGVFSSARMQQRNIVFTIGMLFDPLIEDARLRTYKYFPIKKQVTLEFETDYRHAYCTGYVESNQPNIFSKDEETQISIICPDPYFYEFNQEAFAFSGTHPLFEFPFSNESVREKLIEFGDIKNDSRAVLNYKGDVDTGVFIVCHVMYGSAENLTIWNVDTREHMSIDTTKIMKLTGIQFSQGDDIEINTKVGEKSIRLLHEGKYYNIISCINKDADWFQITNGFNSFAFTAEYGDSNLQLTFNYRNAYGGI